MSKISFRTFIFSLILALLILAPAALAVPREIVEPTFTIGLAISPDAQYVAFYTGADNVIPGDSNGFTDVFVHNRDTDEDDIYDEPGAVSTTNVSVALDGSQANGSSYFPVMSASGRYVAFWSEATNLVADATPVCIDVDSGENRPCRMVYVFDRDTDNDGIFDEPGTVKNQRVSITSAGATPIGDSFIKAISADGRFVSYDSNAGGLVPGDSFNCQYPAGIFSCFDSFVFDRDADNDDIYDEPDAIQTTLVSKAANGDFGNQGSGFSTNLNANGRFVAMRSLSSNLDVDDPNSEWDIFVHDRDLDGDEIFDESGSIDTQVVSVSTNGTLGNGSSYNFPAVLVAINDSGRYVAYESKASNLVAGDTNGKMDVFYHDRDTDNDQIYDEPGAISTIIVSPNGSEDSFFPSLSGDGRYVVFTSASNNLVSGDNNGKRDTFLYDTQTSQLERVSVSDTEVEGNGESDYSAISTNGRYVAFFSESKNLVEGDNNGVVDVFVRDRQAGTTSRIRMAGDEMTDNLSFEKDANNDKLPDGWKGKGLLKDKTVCNKPDKIVAHEGECAFQFKGSTGENSKISQKSDPAGLNTGDVLTVSLYATGNNLIGSAQVQVKAKYSDPNLEVEKFTVTIAEGTYAYALVSGEPVSLLGPLAKLTTQVKFKATKGKLYIDELHVTASSSTGSTFNPLLPLPVAP